MKESTPQFRYFINYREKINTLIEMFQVLINKF